MSVETAKASPEERRKSIRKAAVRGGEIIYGRDRSSMYCVLLDISEDGARLVPANITNCPDRFSLKIAPQPHCDCKVIWRRYTQMGVKFDPAQTRNAIRPPRPRMWPDDQAIARLYNGARYANVDVGREAYWKPPAPPQQGPAPDAGLGRASHSQAPP
jgi:hypothetical protein